MLLNFENSLPGYDAKTEQPCREPKYITSYNEKMKLNSVVNISKQTFNIKYHVRQNQ